MEVRSYSRLVTLKNISKNLIFYCLVNERVMQDDECPWRILTDMKKVFGNTRTQSLVSDVGNMSLSF